MDFSLSEELQQLQQEARDFAAQEIAPVAAEWDRRGQVPMEVVAKAFAQGLLYLTAPKALGGRGCSALGSAIATEELAYGCAGITTTIMANGLALTPLLLFGTAEQLERFVRPFCGQPQLAAFCLTERQAGSDAGAIGATALADGDDYVINGVKCFITNGSLASLYTVFALSDPDRGARGASAFVVPADTPGVQITKVEDKLGQRASDTAEITFTDVRVPKANLLAKEGRGLQVALKTLDFARAGVGALATGLARRALDLAVAYAKERQQFGQPIAQQQMIQQMLADMATRVDAARLLTWRAAWMVDQEMRVSRESAMAKCFAADTAMSVATDAVQVFGGYGYMRDYPAEKLMRDAKLLQIYEGTNQIQRLVIARHL
ncbi:MAG: acyl-CoA dehydrogenase [Chloroflexi bacterium]|nr:acyl-CoA dehydrogenase [Chloroflexota bacterium]